MLAEEPALRHHPAGFSRGFPTTATRVGGASEPVVIGIVVVLA